MSKEDKELNKRKLTPSDFKNHPKVMACVKAVKDNPPTVSDVIDMKGNQYVNLVQKGGGVLGIALVGYTYVLEQADIRFLKLAGTSAGAINTALIVIPGDKSEAKSDILLKALSELDLFKLVDGHPFARTVIKNFVKKPNFLERLKKLGLITVIVLLGLLFGGFLSLGLQHNYKVFAIVTCVVFVLTGLYFLCLGIFRWYISSLIKRLKNAGFGINPGDYFYDWVKAHMLEHHVETVSQLIEKAETVPELKLRADRHEGTDNLKGDVVFIASELVTQNKFELPRMSNLFRTEKDMHLLQPAGFVRASMSIPIFFESYYVKDIPYDDENVRSSWKKTFDVKDPPKTLRFVDGGILSNFPINLFYNKDIAIPRLPTFGIDLDDTKPDERSDDPETWSFGGYLGRMLNTMRYYYDKDFALENRIMLKGVGKVPVSKFNWLNFFLTNTEKVDLFVAGAEAARKFLLEDFKWEVYKTKRKDFAQKKSTV